MPWNAISSRVTNQGRCSQVTAAQDLVSWSILIGKSLSSYYIHTYIHTYISYLLSARSVAWAVILRRCLFRGWRPRDTYVHSSCRYYCIGILVFFPCLRSTIPWPCNPYISLLSRVLCTLPRAYYISIYTHVPRKFHWGCFATAVQATYTKLGSVGDWQGCSASLYSDATSRLSNNWATRNINLTFKVMTPLRSDRFGFDVVLYFFKWSKYDDLSV